MKHLWLWIHLLAKRQLHHKVMAFFLIIMPIAALIIINIPAMVSDGIPKVGIMLSDEDNTAIAIKDELIDTSASLQFVLYTDEREMTDDITNATLQCGYIFNPNITQRLDSSDYTGVITLVNNNSSFISSMSNEIVFAALFRTYAKNIGVAWIQNNISLPSIQEITTEKFLAKYDDYIHGSATFHLEYEVLDQHSTNQSNDTPIDNGVKEIEVKNVTFPIRGILAILILIAGLFGVIQWISDKNSDVFAPMSHNLIIISRLLYTLVPSVMYGLSAIITLYISKTAGNIIHELLSMLIYILIITLVGFVLTLIVKKSGFIISLIPVIIIGSLVFCPVFLDISVYVPFVNVINKLFLPYYYLLIA